MRFRTSHGPDGGRIRRGRRKLSTDDVSELALAALERSEAVLENIGDGVFATDQDGHIVIWNRAAQRVVGCTARKATGQSCSDVLGLTLKGNPLDCSEGCALLRELNGDAPMEGIEVSRTRKDGREQPLLINVTAVMDQGGHIAEVVHSMRDITALKQADEAKTMFLATASHELKTPLTVILGFTQALRSDWLKGEQREDALQSIERRAKELSKIVDRMLLTGRIEAGRVTIALSPVNLSGFVCERASALGLATGRTIMCDVSEELPAALADSEALTTVIDHLLDNAVKYSPDGGEVSVFARADRSGVEISISDEGIGMSEEESAHCFDRFWQAETSDVRRFGGTGVGLYIVRSLVEGMGGTVAVRSIPGSGATFIIRLRRASEEDVEKTKVPEDRGVGKRTMIQEFMHQIGVPGGGGGGGS